MPLLDLSHTSHTRARTGIQRVARALQRELGAGAASICYDPFFGGWRSLEAWELANLSGEASGGRRGASWPLVARVRGRLRRLSGRRAALPSSDGILVPEVFSPSVAAALPDLFARTGGPKAAIFHDAIALRLPEMTPAKTVARFPSYLRELLAFDGIAAISEDSRQSLLDYWGWLGVTAQPAVTVIPLGIECPNFLAREAPQENLPRRSPNGGEDGLILSVGTLEARKNHLALLDACESLWLRGLRFKLHLIGLPRPETARAALDKIAALQSAGRPLRYDGPADDAALEAAYRAATFTIYPSLMEGFGLPVLESLARGKPCVCSGRGALGESARGGGCLALDSVDSASLAAAIERLLAEPGLAARLEAEARARRFKSWADYAREVFAWMKGLKSRN